MSACAIPGCNKPVKQQITKPSRYCLEHAEAARGGHRPGYRPPRYVRKESRAVTIAPRVALSRAEILAGQRLDVPDEPRPATRGDCLPFGTNAERPCPWVSCKFHLFLDVTSGGGLKLNFPGAEVQDLPETCALDVADRPDVTLEEVGRLTNLTRERIRQIEQRALARMAKRGDFEDAPEHRSREEVGDAW